jgi:hypothetical protein
MVLTIFLSLAAALVAAVLALGAALLISYELVLGDLGMALSFYIAPLKVVLDRFGRDLQ